MKYSTEINIQPSPGKSMGYATYRRNIAEQLASPGSNAVDIYAIARELSQMQISGDVEAVKRLRDAYIIGLGRIKPAVALDELRNMADENLATAAGLADIVSACGYEASGQLIMKPSLHGPVGSFYFRAVGIKQLQ